MASDEKGEEYSDNGERAIFFARGVLETVKKLRWVPDIIHCQGWMSSVVPLYVKTAYHEEPSFANTKVVTSLFPKSLNKSIGDNFKRSLEFRDVKADLLGKYSDNFDFDELIKLAIDNSDGVIEVGDDVSADLADYAMRQNIPLLKNPGTDFVDSYEKFYNQICED